MPNEIRLMARPLRITYPGAFYHVTSRGNERKKIFKTERDREKFLEYLSSASERYGAAIHVFCLMDNHYHLLLETPSGNLPQIMRHINGAYTTYFNVKRKRSGHLFQGRYKAILVDIDEYAKELSRYIHLNPVRAKMTESPQEYKWSSYAAYIGKVNTPDWLNREFILGHFGDKLSTAQKNYRRFTDAVADQTYGNPMDAVVSSTILGAPDFVDFIKEKYLFSQKPDKEIPALKVLANRLSIEDIFDEAEAVFGDEPNLCRSVKMYLCQKKTGKKLKEIGAHFNIGESGVSQSSRRIRQKIKKDKQFKKRITQIEKKLNMSRMKT